LYCKWKDFVWLDDLLRTVANNDSVITKYDCGLLPKFGSNVAPILWMRNKTQWFLAQAEGVTCALSSKVRISTLDQSISNVSINILVNHFKFFLDRMDKMVSFSFLLNQVW
jgi:hypothetical protein